MSSRSSNGGKRNSCGMSIWCCSDGMGVRGKRLAPDEPSRYLPVPDFKPAVPLTVDDEEAPGRPVPVATLPEHVAILRDTRPVGHTQLPRIEEPGLERVGWPSRRPIWMRDEVVDTLHDTRQSAGEGDRAVEFDLEGFCYLAKFLHRIRPGS